MSIKCGKAWLEMKEYNKAKYVFLQAQTDISSLMENLKTSVESGGAVGLLYKYNFIKLIRYLLQKI